MRFVYPEFLWSLFLLAIPVIIHLYNFRRYKTHYFSSLLFLKKVEQTSRKTRTVKHLLVLISRLLFLAALIFAFAQPYLPFDDNEESGGNPLVALYIDNSFSMGQIGTEGELIAEARETAKKIVTDLDNEARILVATNALNGAEKRIVSKAEAIDIIDKIKLSPMRRTSSEVLNWVQAFKQQYSREEEKISLLKCIYLSDFQKITTDKQPIDFPKSDALYPVQFLPQKGSNLTVDSLWFESPNLRAGTTEKLFLRVHNYGESDVTNAQVEVSVNSFEKDFFVDVKAGQSTITSISIKIEKNTEGSEGVVSVLDQQMFFDDALYFSFTGQKNSEVLIIDGENAVNNVQRVFQQDSFYRVQSTTIDQVRSDALKQANMIVLNGVNKVSNGLADDLVDFKASLGNIFVFPGIEIDESSLNLLLTRLGLPTINGTTTEGNSLRALTYQDPFFEPVFEKKPDKINLSNISVLYNSQATSSLSLATAQNGRSILSSSLDRKAFLFHSSLVEEYSSFVNNALFPTVLLRAGEMSSQLAPLYLTIGDDTRFPIYRKKRAESPLHLIGENLDMIPELIQQNQAEYIVFSNVSASELLKAGNYQLKAEGYQSPFALNYNRTESDIRLLKEEEIKDYFAAKGIENILPFTIKNQLDSVQIDLNQDASFWKLFVWLALAFFLAEMALLKFWKS